MNKTKVLKNQDVKTMSLKTNVLKNICQTTRCYKKLGIQGLGYLKLTQQKPKVNENH